jgi:hypothetical protein
VELYLPHIFMVWCLIKHRTTLTFSPNTFIYTRLELVIVRNATHAVTCLCIVVCSQITGVLNYRCSEAVRVGWVMEVGAVVVNVVCVYVAFVKY